MTWFGISPPTRTLLAVMLNPNVICETARWRRSISLKPCASQAFIQSFSLPQEQCMGIYAGTSLFLSLQVHYCQYPLMALVRLEVRHLYPPIVTSMVYRHGCS